MFNRGHLVHVLRLQQMSYRLLQWVGRNPRQQGRSLRAFHDVASDAAAAEEWLTFYKDQLPRDVVPEPADVRVFSRLFSSYLTSSFELSNKPTTYRGEDEVCGCCGCRFARYLSTGSHLKTRKITNAAKHHALQLKEIYLEGSADEIGRKLTPARIGELAIDLELSYNLSLATYASELIRRTRYASQGTGVLVLWRAFAWKDNHPRKGFRLDADMILAAESAVLDLLRSEADASSANEPHAGQDE